MGRGRSRILYWFRTPPGVRVGRAALDEDAIRLIEEYNPEIEFDWTRILKGQGVETAPPRDLEARQDKRHRTESKQARRPVESPVPALAAVHDDEPATEGPHVEVGDLAEELGAVPLSADEGAALEPPHETVPAATPAHARIGFEGVSRLRARYAELMARIGDRIPDPARQEELKTQAERLNPDTWVTDAEVTEGLEKYETVFESVRSIVGGQPRRRRRKRRRGAVQPPQAPTAGAGSGGLDDASDADAGPDER